MSVLGLHVTKATACRYEKMLYTNIMYVVTLICDIKIFFKQFNTNWHVRLIFKNDSYHLELFLNKTCAYSKLAKLIFIIMKKLICGTIYFTWKPNSSIQLCIHMHLSLMPRILSTAFTLNNRELKLRV